MKSGSAPQEMHSSNTEISTPSVSNPFETLPPELMVMIFKDASVHELIKLGEVNKYFHQISKTPSFWKTFISKHFPYAINMRPEQYQDTPYQLYKDCYIHYMNAQRIIDLAYNNTRTYGLKDVPSLETAMKHLLAAYEGDLTPLAQPEYNHRVQRTIYKLAAANGQLSAWQQLEENERKQIFDLAEKNSSLPTLLTHIPESWDILSSAQKRQSLKKLGELGINLLLETIFNKQDPAITCMAIYKAATTAANCGQLNTMILLFEKLGSKKTKHLSTRALEAATENSHKNIVFHLLPNTTPSAPSLINAAKNGDLDIVQAFLDAKQKRASRFQSTTLKLAAKAAQAKNHVDIAQLLLEPFADKPSDELPLSNETATILPEKDTENDGEITKVAIMLATLKEGKKLCGEPNALVAPSNKENVSASRSNSPSKNALAPKPILNQFKSSQSSNFYLRQITCSGTISFSIKPTPKAPLSPIKLGK